MKFTLIEGCLLPIILPKLKELGFVEIHNWTTGGDNDFIILDAKSKQYAFFEHGYRPYRRELWEYHQKTIKDLIAMRSSQFIKAEFDKTLDFLASNDVFWVEKGKDFLSISGSSFFSVALSKVQLESLIAELEEIKNSLP